MFKFNVIFKILTTTVLFSSALALSPVHASDEADLICSVCKKVDVPTEVYSYQSSYVLQIPDETLAEQLYYGNAPLDLEYLLTMAAGAAERCTNIDENSIDLYFGFIDEVMLVATNYGDADLDAYAENKDQWGVTGITMSKAKETLEWLKVNRSDVYEKIMSLMSAEYKDDLESNLLYNVPFNIAVAIEAVWLSCPVLPSKFVKIKNRARIYSEVIRGGDKEARKDFKNILKNHTLVNGVPAGEDWSYID